MIVVEQALQIIKWKPKPTKQSPPQDQTKSWQGDKTLDSKIKIKIQKLQQK
jgi:hypothetical protein